MLWSHWNTIFMFYSLLWNPFFVLCEVYNISDSLSCTTEPCFTLTDLATDLGRYLYSNTTLIILPGNHKLQMNLSVSNVTEFSMVASNSYGQNTIVFCNTTGLHFKQVGHVHIRGITFRGCGGNTVENVNNLVLKKSIFQGSIRSRTALLINETEQATIRRCIFINYTLGYNYDVRLPQYYTVSGPMNVGGALVVIHSSTEMYECIFEGNSAELGSTIFADNGSIINVTDSSFYHNHGGLSSQSEPGHSMFAIDKSSLFLHNCTFSNNSGKFGVIGVINSDLHLNMTYFFSNAATHDGGAITAYRSEVIMDQSIFSHNLAEFLGGVVQATETSIVVRTSTFSYNTANNLGGTFHIYNCSLAIYNSDFTYSRAYEGGVIYAQTQSTLTISASNFNSNYADLSGGVIAIRSGSVEEYGSTFTNNSAQTGGVIDMSKSEASFMQSTFGLNIAQKGGAILSAPKSALSLVNVVFSNNTATSNGAVLYVTATSVYSEFCEFTDNSANLGAVLDIFQNTANITESKFINNHASHGVLQTTQCNLVLHGLTLTNNSAQLAVTYIYQSRAVFTGKTLLVNNKGSLYVFDSHVTFLGNTSFVGGEEPSNQSYYQGGALTSYRSVIDFNGSTNLLYNTARRGGAIFALETSIYIYGETSLKNNEATDVGGGTYIYQTVVTVEDTKCVLMNNQANRSGGGVYSVSSIIITAAYEKPTLLHFVNNSAIHGGGGGLYFEANSKLNVLKRIAELHERQIEIIFTANSAQNGGAIYVADETNSRACAVSTECFFQILSLHMEESLSLNTVNVLFSQNYAFQLGSDLFGGLIDRCIPSAFAEINKVKTNDVQPFRYNGTCYLIRTTDITLDSVASLPVRVCFCRDSVPDCNYQLEMKTVKKGEQFTIEVVAVDQVDHPISTNVTTSLQSTESGLSGGQVSQYINSYCTNLTFNVQSPQESEKLFLYAEGPCDSREYSTAAISIIFGACTCPIGFDSIETRNNCECTCASELSPHTTDCDPVSESFVKADSSWISYTNQTEPSGYIIHPHCPYDYCLPPSNSVRINFNELDGGDAQCNFNRRGVLCGACKEPLSLSLGSSLCLNCPTYWPAFFTGYIFFFLGTGIVMVVLIMVLNLTVAVGTINAFIFYVNIVDLQRSIFFPTEEALYPSIIISALNLDIQLNFCIYKGMDAYTKTWFKMAYPAYIIFLVILIITLSKYSNKFANFIGKKDPVATLATLILLSYTRLLDFIIEGLALVTLYLPDGSVLYVWLPDANVNYFLGKHAPLFIVALCVLILYVIFTLLLLVWQWIERCRKRRPLNLINSQKFASFMEMYHIPFNARFRYWTGLLLLIRVVLYIINIINVKRDSQLQLSATIFSVAALLLIKGVYTKPIYRQWPLDAMETIIYFNIIIFATFTSYTQESGGNQVAVASVSTTITYIMVVIVLAYHTYKYTCLGTLVKKMNLRNQLTSKLLIFKRKISYSSQSETTTLEVTNLPVSQPRAIDMSQYRNSILDVVQPPTEDDYLQLQILQSEYSLTIDKETPPDPPTFSTIDLSEDSPEEPGNYE